MADLITAVSLTDREKNYSIVMVKLMKQEKVLLKMLNPLHFLFYLEKMKEQGFGHILL